MSVTNIIVNIIVNIFVVRYSPSFSDQSVGLTSWLLTVYWTYLLIVFLCFSSIFLCFSYSYVRQTKLASSLVVNFRAHNKIVSDWLIDWLLWRRLAYTAVAVHLVMCVAFVCCSTSFLPHKSLRNSMTTAGEYDPHQKIFTTVTNNNYYYHYELCRDVFGGVVV